MVWYSHLLKNFPQLGVIHTVKGFGIVKKAEVDVFLGFPCSSVGKEFACSAGDPGSVPGLGRSPEGEHGNHSNILVWRTAWTEEPGGLQSMGSCTVRQD